MFLPNLEILSIILLTLLLAEVALAILLFTLGRKIFNQQKHQLKMIQDSSTELRSILTKTEQLDQRMLQLAEEKLEHLFDGIPSILDEISKQGKSELSSNLSSQEELIKQKQVEFTDLIKTASQELLNDFKSQLTEIVTNQDTVFQKTLTAMSAESQKRVFELQEKQAEMVTAQAEKLASQVAREILLKNLNSSNHHQIALQAIQKAWEEGVFDENSK